VRYLAVSSWILLLACGNDSAQVGTVTSGTKGDLAACSRSLEDLCQLYPSDKCPYHHNYIEVYAQIFEPMCATATRVLEIGVLRGDSMRLWEGYFPNAHIFGLDIKDTSSNDTDRITTFIADQSSRSDLTAFLEQYSGDFDVIIDDGGHRMHMQQISFGFLFPYVRPGGLYVIEDIHTSFPNLYPGYDVDADQKNTTFEMITTFVRAGSFSSQYLSAEENEYLSKNVESCMYWLRSNEFHSDMFVCKKAA